MHRFRISIAIVAISSTARLTCPSVSVASADALGTTANQPIRMEVETMGSLPDYPQYRLPAYISQRMATQAAGGWRFVPAPPLSQFPNRVIWTFHLLPNAAGTVRYIGPGSTGLTVPPGIARKVAIEVVLVRDKMPPDIVTSEVTINGYGRNDEDLDAVVSSVLKRLNLNASIHPQSSG